MKKTIWACAVWLITTAVLAESPQKTTIADIGIGQTVDTIVASLKKTYPKCLVEVLQYKVDSVGATPIAQVTMNDDVVNIDENCDSAQKLQGKIDRWEVSFVHSSIKSTSPSYRVRLDRRFVYTFGSKEITFKELIEHLSSEFGKPTLVEFDLNKFSAQLEKISNPRGKSSPDVPYKLKATWTRKLTKNSLGLCPIELCGETTLVAEIGGRGRAKATQATANAESVTLVLTDQSMDEQQISWLARMDQQKRNAAKKF